MPKQSTLNSEQMQAGLGKWYVKYVAQSSPATKMIVFYVFAGVFCLLAQATWLIICITLVYAVLIPILLIFKPDRVWSEPTMLEWYKLGLGHKGGKVTDIIEGEIVQPIFPKSNRGDEKKLKKKN